MKTKIPKEIPKVQHTTTQIPNDVALTCAQCDKSLIKGTEPIYVIQTENKDIFYLCKPCVQICAERANT